MKQIRKRPEPAYFVNWKENFRRTHKREPLYEDFRGSEEWEQMIQTLLEEQGYICCYCTMEIQGWDSHIEHFIPRNIKNRYPHSTRARNVELNYQNLFESCNGEDASWDHCGRYKDREDSPMLVSPIEEGIEERFKYDLLTGMIDAADPNDQAVMTTIRVLNLNTDRLCQHRLAAFYAAGIFDEEDPEDRKSQIAFYSNRDDKGAFNPFCAAIVWAFRHIS